VLRWANSLLDDVYEEDPHFVIKILETFAEFALEWLKYVEEARRIIESVPHEVIRSNMMVNFYVGRVVTSDILLNVSEETIVLVGVDYDYERDTSVQWDVAEVIIYE